MNVEQKFEAVTGLKKKLQAPRLLINFSPIFARSEIIIGTIAFLTRQRCAYCDIIVKRNPDRAFRINLIETTVSDVGIAIGTLINTGFTTNMIHRSSSSVTAVTLLLER